MRVMISGGGTGGHIYPALAIAEGIRNKYKDSEIIYVGSDNGLEKDLASREGFEFRSIPVASLGGGLSLRMVKTCIQNLKGLSQSKKLLKSFSPDVVIGTGGYVCGPLMLAATKCGFPTILHEQNAVMGRTNSALSTKVDKICLTFNIMNSNFKAHEKTIITGLPVRENILNASKDEGIKFFGLDGQKPVVLITGGSQGAQHINNASVEIIEKIIAAGAQVLHLTGPKLYKEVETQAKALGIFNNPDYKIVSYLHEMEMALGAADIIICRAGASFLAEVMAVGRCSILVPYPYAVGDHQKANAMSLVNRNAAKMILDKDLTAETLWAELLPLLNDSGLVAEMGKNSYEMGRRNAVDDILKQVDEVVKKRR